MFQWLVLVAFVATTIPIRAQETEEDPLNLMRPFPEQKTCANQIKEMIDLENNIVKIDHSVKQETWESYYNCYTEFPGTIYISDTSFFVQFNTPKVGETLKPDYQINVVYKNFWNQTSVVTKDLRLMVNCNEKLRFNIESEYQIGEVYKIGQNDISTVALLIKLLSCMDDRSFFNNMKSCHVPHPLSGMKILDPCEAVEQLIINDMTKEESTEAAIYFVYKLEVLNSNFKDLSFLKMDSTKWQYYKTLYDHYVDASGKESDGDYNRTFFESKDDQAIVVQNNKQLCLSLEFEQFFKSRSKIFVLSNNANFDDDSCKVTCNANEAISSYTCNVITEDVDVDCSLIPNYNDTFKTENWAAGIGYNRVTVETGIITLRNCQTHTIGMYFGRVKNMKDVTSCHVPHPLPSMNILDPCEAVEQLIINEMTKIETTEAAIYFVYKLEVLNSNFKDLSFLKMDATKWQYYKTLYDHYVDASGKESDGDYNRTFFKSKDDQSIVVQNNKQLCLSLEFEQFFKPRSKTFILSNNANFDDDSCKVTCNASEAISSSTCNVITEDVDVDCSLIPNYKDTFKTENWAAGIGYNRVTVETGRITLRNCETHTISMYFERVKNIKDVIFTVQNVQGDIKLINANPWPKVFKVEYFENTTLSTTEVPTEAPSPPRGYYPNSGYGHSYYSGNGNNNANNEDEDKAEGQALFISLFVGIGVLILISILSVVAGVVYIYCKNVHIPKKRTGKPAGKGGTPVATHWKVPAGLLED